MALVEAGHYCGSQRDEQKDKDDCSQQHSKIVIYEPRARHLPPGSSTYRPLVFSADSTYCIIKSNGLPLAELLLQQPAVFCEDYNAPSSAGTEFRDLEKLDPIDSSVEEASTPDRTEYSTMAAKPNHVQPSADESEQAGHPSFQQPQRVREQRSSHWREDPNYTFGGPTIPREPQWQYPTPYNTASQSRPFGRHDAFEDATEQQQELHLRLPTPFPMGNSQYGTTGSYELHNIRDPRHHQPVPNPYNEPYTPNTYTNHHYASSGTYSFSSASGSSARNVFSVPQPSPEQNMSDWSTSRYAAHPSTPNVRSDLAPGSYGGYDGHGDSFKQKITAEDIPGKNQYGQRNTLFDPNARTFESESFHAYQIRPQGRGYSELGANATANLFDRANTAHDPAYGQVSLPETEQTSDRSKLHQARQNRYPEKQSCFCGKDDNEFMVKCADFRHEFRFLGPVAAHIECVMGNLPTADDIEEAEWYCQACTNFNNTDPLGRARDASAQDEKVLPNHPLAGQVIIRRQSLQSRPQKRGSAIPKESSRGKWSEDEEEACIRIMTQVKTSNYEGTIDELWIEISRQMNLLGFSRTSAAVKNMWNRQLRYKSRFDERARKKPHAMITGRMRTSTIKKGKAVLTRQVLTSDTTASLPAGSTVVRKPRRKAIRRTTSYSDNDDENDDTETDYESEQAIAEAARSLTRIKHARIAPKKEPQSATNLNAESGIQSAPSADSENPHDLPKSKQTARPYSLRASRRQKTGPVSYNLDYGSESDAEWPKDQD